MSDFPSPFLLNQILCGNYRLSYMQTSPFLLQFIPFFRLIFPPSLSFFVLGGCGKDKILFLITPEIHTENPIWKPIILDSKESVFE